MCLEIERSGHSAGKEKHIGIGEIALRELNVGNDLNVVRASNRVASVYRYGFCIESGTYKTVHNSQRLDFFKAVGKKSVYSIHIY